MSPNKPQVLFIVGPTSTGKTSLALSIAKKFHGDLVSADSRQVYKGLDILTGKDIPTEFIFDNDRYTNGDISIYGLDLIDPTQQWSAGLFFNYAKNAIQEIISKGRLPIVVGGTGFYVQSLLTGSLPPSAPPNDLFRKRLENESLEYLQNQLKQTDPERHAKMNHSDLSNKRRLIRGLEIAFYRKLQGQSKATRELTPPGYDTLVIGLTAPIEQIRNKIQHRVEKRLDQGVQQELSILQNTPDKVNLQSYSILGYKELDEYAQGKITREKLQSIWTTKERQYAKRQITWFKKQTNINWYDITSPNFKDQVEAQVTGWYSQNQ